MQKFQIQSRILLLLIFLISINCNSPHFRKTSYDYTYYYSRNYGYRYAPGTGHSFSWDACTTLAEAKVRGSRLYVLVKKGPWIAFPIIRNNQRFNFRMTDQGMFMKIKSSQGWKIFTQKNGSTWEQRQNGSCLLLK